jgi:alpha-galactosidase
MRIIKTTVALTALACLALWSGAAALDNGLARTPAMGFNTWNYFGCNGSDPDGASRPIVTDVVFLDIAKAFVSSGMKDAGYKYVNYDDCWAEGSRDARGGLVPKRSVFTRGIKFVVDSIHNMGLYIGLYGDAADRTCAGTMPGQLGHEQQDADSLVAWGIDYFKYDWCGRSGDARPDFRLMRNCLDTAVAKARRAGRTARPILYSICNWGQGTVKPWIWGDTTGNSWRTTYDIRPNWNNAIGMCYAGNVVLAQYAKPGAWNDADMLEVGNGMSLTEDQTHFALWCMMASPLLAGNDVRNMNASIRDILTNREVIAVNQDSLGFQCRRVQVSGNLEVLAKKLRSSTPGVSVPDYAICFLNRGTTTASMSVIMDTIWKADPTGPQLPKNSNYKVRNLITKTQLPNQKGSLPFMATNVPAHGCHLIRIVLDTAITGAAPAAATPAHFGLTARLSGGRVIIAGVQADAAISLTNLSGSVVFNRSFAGKADIAIPTEHLAKGVYSVNIRTAPKAMSWKMVLR